MVTLLSDCAPPGMLLANITMLALLVQFSSLTRFVPLLFQDTFLVQLEALLLIVQSVIVLLKVPIGVWQLLAMKFLIPVQVLQALGLVAPLLHTRDPFGLFCDPPAPVHPPLHASH